MGILASLLLAGGASFLTEGCAGPQAVSVNAPVDVPGNPPPLVTETIPPSPGYGYYWIAGAWIWGGNNWAWEPGRWQLPPHPGAVWVPHQYIIRDGRHIFIRGGWR